MTEQPYKPKVLVVDDEPQILESIHALLEDDFDVVTSNDASSAVEFLKDAQIAVILADQRMPKLTGGEFLAKAREVSDATRILITGYVDIDALIRAVNDGQIHSYIPKPWEPANLKVTVLKAATYSKELSQRKKAAEIVSEQQKALARSEAAYRQQTKILRSVLDSMSDGVLVTNEEGKMLLLNPAAEQMVGVGAHGNASIGMEQALWSLSARHGHRSIRPRSCLWREPCAAKLRMELSCTCVTHTSRMACLSVSACGR